MRREAYQNLEQGKRIKIAMIALGITNKELARQLNYKESTLCDVLKGRNRSERRISEIWAALTVAEGDGNGKIQ